VGRVGYTVKIPPLYKAVMYSGSLLYGLGLWGTTCRRRFLMKVVGKNLMRKFSRLLDWKSVTSLRTKVLPCVE
jgi:hypothetical protein